MTPIHPIRRKRLKIALVSPYDVAYPGGVTEHMLALATALRRRGHTVQILAICSNYQNRRLADVTVVTHRITTFPIAGTVARVGLSPFNYFKIRRFLQAEAFDVIHLQEPLTPSITWLVLLQASALPRTVTIGTFHAYHERPNWFYAHGRPLFGYFFTKLDSLIAVSAAARDFARQMFAGEYKIIPNGIDLNRFGIGHAGPPSPPRGGEKSEFVPPSPPRGGEKSEFVPPSPPQGGEKSGLPPTGGLGGPAKESEFPPTGGPGPTPPLNILFVGRLDARKGFHCLLDSFIALKPAYPHLRLTVIGPFEPKDCRLYQKAAQRHGVTDIDFVGYVSPERLPDFYRQADIFCAPSMGYESFGIVLLEAMAAGLPIVASDIVGYRTVLTHGQEGLLVPPGDPAPLAAALRYLIDDPHQRRRLGQRGRQKAQHYSWDRIVEEILDLYRQTIEAKLTLVSPVTSTVQALETGTYRGSIGQSYPK